MFFCKIKLRISIVSILLFTGKLVNAQIIIDSDFKDTIGVSTDIAIISKKIEKLPDSVVNSLVCVKVQYYSFDKFGNVDTLELHQGIIIVNKLVSDDIKFLFEELKKIKFPIHKVVPVNKYGLNEDSTGWNDNLSMADNNTSGFNYRNVTQSNVLSPHAFGLAIDINPLFNPYEKYIGNTKTVEPKNAFYDLSRPGTVTDDIVTGLFDQRGWVWGGRWNNPVDYQHFDLRMDRSMKHYLFKSSNLKELVRIDDKTNEIKLYDNQTDLEKNKVQLVINLSEKERFLRKIEKWNYQDLLEKWNQDTIQEIIEESKSLKKIALYSLDNVFVDEDDEIEILEKLSKKLKSKNFEVDILDIQRDSIKQPYDIAFGLSLNPRYFNQSKDDFQVIFVPGAFKTEDFKNFVDRLQLLRLFIGDDFQNSYRLANIIQNKLLNKFNLTPVSRQLDSPNMLERDCIKTNTDGIYCRNISSFKQFDCPVMWLYVFDKNISKKENKFNPKNKSDINKMVRSIKEGILEYYAF
jgi:hypothetical protein